MNLQDLKSAQCLFNNHVTFSQPLPLMPARTWNSRAKTRIRGTYSIHSVSLLEESHTLAEGIAYPCWRDHISLLKESHIPAEGICASETYHRRTAIWGCDGQKLHRCLRGWFRSRKWRTNSNPHRSDTTALNDRFENHWVSWEVSRVLREQSPRYIFTMCCVHPSFLFSYSSKTLLYSPQLNTAVKTRA